MAELELDMRSLMYNFTKEELREIIEKSSSIRRVLSLIGYGDKGGNRKTLFKVIEYYGLNNELEELKKRTKEFSIEKTKLVLSKRYPIDDEIFCEHSKSTRNNVKDKIIRRGLLEYKCSFCGNTGEYNGKPLVLQLDHINGIGDDNRLENLRFLCPNCHSQTETYSGKSLKVKMDKKVSKSWSIKQEELIKERLEYLSLINLDDRNWIDKVSKDWNVTNLTVKRWIAEHDVCIKYIKGKYVRV